MMLEGNLSTLNNEFPHRFNYLVFETFYFFDLPYIPLVIHGFFGSIFLLGCFY